MANTGIADVAVTIEEVISALTTQTLIQSSVALQIPGVWDRSGEVRPGMDTLDMIELAELAIQTVDETGAAMTPQTINPTAAKLLLNQHKSIPFSLTSRGDLQSKIALVQRTVENGARTLAADIDDTIFAEAASAAGTTDVSASVDGLSDVLKAKKQFDLDNVPREMRALVGSPGWINDALLASNNVIRANEYGSDAPVRKGFVATVYDFIIFESSSSAIPDDGYIAFGMEALAFARQRAMEFERQRQVLSQKDDYAMTHLFGVKSTAASNPRLFVYDPA